LAAAAFGAVFLIGGAVHYYFLACLAPFAILALSQRRIFHPKVIAAAVGAMGSLAVLYPQVASSLSKVHGGAYPAWALPPAIQLHTVYAGFFPAAIVPLVILAIGVAVLGKTREHLVKPMSEGERVAWLFLIIPVPIYIAAKLVTHFFVDRYMTDVVPGVALAASCLVWRYCRGSKYLLPAILVLVGGFGMFQQLLTARHVHHIDAYGDHQERTREMLAVEDALKRDGKSRFAFSNNLQFVEAWYYSKYQGAYGLYWPVPMGALTLEKYAPVKFVTVSDIAANAAQTAVIAPDNRLLAELERAGLHPKIHFTEPYIFYLE
jgi:hypothetical protein